MDEEKRAKIEELRAELERKRHLVREAMDYINDDRNLTVEGIRLREALWREMEEIEKDTEAVRQEHRPDEAFPIGNMRLRGPPAFIMVP